MDYFSEGRLRSWSSALDDMCRIGFFGPPERGGGRGSGSGARAGRERDRSLGSKRRAELLRVLMICEANTFGEGEDQGEPGLLGFLGFL